MPNLEKFDSSHNKPENKFNQQNKDISQSSTESQRWTRNLSSSPSDVSKDLQAKNPLIQNLEEKFRPVKLVDSGSLLKSLSAFSLPTGSSQVRLWEVDGQPAAAGGEVT